MKRGLVRLLGFGLFFKIFSGIALEAHCPTTNDNTKYKKIKYKEFQNEFYDTTNLKRYNNYLKLWEKN